MLALCTLVHWHHSNDISRLVQWLTRLPSSRETRVQTPARQLLGVSEMAYTDPFLLSSIPSHHGNQQNCCIRKATLECRKITTIGA